MIKITVEGATTVELSLKLLEIGQLLAAEPVPRAPTKAKREGKGGAEKPPAADAATSSPASTPAAGAEPDPTPTPAPAPEQQTQAPAPAEDSEAVRAKIRQILNAKIKEGKQPAVQALITSYAPVLSQVPADKLAEVSKLAEAL